MTDGVEKLKVKEGVAADDGNPATDGSAQANGKGVCVCTFSVTFQASEEMMKMLRTNAPDVKGAINNAISLAVSKYASLGSGRMFDYTEKMQHVTVVAPMDIKKLTVDWPPLAEKGDYIADVEKKFDEKRAFSLLYMKYCQPKLASVDGVDTLTWTSGWALPQPSNKHARERTKDGKAMAAIVLEFDDKYRKQVEGPLPSDLTVNNPMFASLCQEILRNLKAGRLTTSQKEPFSSGLSTTNHAIYAIFVWDGAGHYRPYVGQAKPVNHRLAPNYFSSGTHYGSISKAIHRWRLAASIHPPGLIDNAVALAVMKYSEHPTYIFIVDEWDANKDSLNEMEKRYAYLLGAMYPQGYTEKVNNTQ
jgi:hypothetical protein